MIFAALSPAYEVERERQAIYRHAEIQEFLESEGQSILRVEGGLGAWRIETELYVIDVDARVHRNPAAPIGPGILELVVHEPVRHSATFE